MIDKVHVYVYVTFEFLTRPKEGSSAVETAVDLLVLESYLGCLNNFGGYNQK